MDLLTITKSKTRQKILQLFIKDPDRDYYLREIERTLLLSAGNIRRDLLSLTKIGLFERLKKGKLIYYKINKDNPLFIMIKSGSTKPKNIINNGLYWVRTKSPQKPEEEVYCQTRDIFQARLQTFTNHIEKKLGNEAYLVSAIAGEIGNNSFDHNLGNWPSIPGIYFGRDESIGTVVLADHGQGILKTIRNVIPKTKDDKDALKVAFTKIISGRSPEMRGNGLKFVAKVIKDHKWTLSFYSGRAVLIIKNTGKLEISESKNNIYGCFALIKY